MAQIGTVRLETQNSGVVDVPVFEPGDSASGIYEYVRVETASGPGFIPVTAPADATYPYLRVQSANDGIVAVTDTAGSDIPDSVEHRYDATEFSATGGDALSSWPDQVGSRDLSSNDAPTLKTNGINGQQVVSFDGSDDSFVNVDIAKSTFPITIFVVGQITAASAATNDHWMEARDNSLNITIQDDNSNGTRAFVDSSQNRIEGGVQDTNPHILELKLDGTAQFWIDGNSVGTVTCNEDPLQKFELAGSGRFLDCDIGEAEILVGHTSTERTKERSRLSDKWGITL